MTHLLDKKELCFGCSACHDACPAGAIRMAADSEGFAYPVIDQTLCTDCGACLKVCPAQVVSGTDLAGGTGAVGQVKAYALRCNDTELLKASTSGGAFSVLAQPVLESGGLVAGAAFDDNFQVKHLLAENIDSFRKSKYVQSDASGIYKAVKSALGDGRKVLFSGTPCQCHALLQFLGNQPDSLTVVSLVCRGVQSPGLWKAYTEHLNKNGTLSTYCFRDKRVQNDAHTVSYTAGGKDYAAAMNKDPFSMLYTKCLTLRPSCYTCPYTRSDLPFDITIGDFWGVEKVLPQFADGRGTSLVLVRTERGKELLEKAVQNATVIEVPLESAAQTALRTPAPKSMLRKFFFKQFADLIQKGENPIPFLLAKYGAT